MQQPGPESDRARWIRAYALFNTGHLAASELLNGRALEGFRAGGDRWGIAAVHGLRAMHALIRGDLTAISRDGTRSIALFRELGDSWGQLQSVAPLASLAEAYGEYDRAEELLRDGTAMAEALGLATELSALLSRQGRIALLTGDTSRARALHERARKLAAEQGYKFGEIHAELGLALGARREGDLDTAEAVLHRIRAWYAEVSTEAGNALVLAELGFTAELRGDAETARAHHLDALAAARPLGDPRAVALPLEGLAGAELLAGDAERAARLLGTAAAARASVGVPLPPPERGDVDRITAGAKRVLGGTRGSPRRSRRGTRPVSGRGSHPQPLAQRSCASPLVGGSALRLSKADAVAERVAKPAVDPVRALRRLLGEFDALGQQRLVRLAAVLRGEDDPAAHGALGHQLADLLCRLLGHRRGAGLLQQDLAARLTGHVDGQPPHEAQIGVGVDLQAELADVEVEGLVLVEDVYLRVRDGVEHALRLWRAQRRKLLRNCSSPADSLNSLTSPASLSRWAASTPSRNRSARPPPRRSCGTPGATSRRSPGTSC
ncbi:hypothetical protein GCM10020000_35320 [Streptomyces olivoverticillatus]